MDTKVKSVQDLPFALSAADVADILGISRANAYNLLKSKNFPTLHIGKRMVVPKYRLFEWIDNNIQVANG
ncbi:helix-turn-helix domain-containing protein [Paludicola sp. MB14-C6]|uniref:helix-turn-helix domain-containing protein n=1 Tax=Paludihabitans sp. MB14-C6 TaxID=3070656 RepID=UPI0027DD666C|nr:helix-turn-helix domain-containing protein [Paludicola sp. MB14-C6]WMJ22197.1 helix-turn-helix domain-containing protein [Paludicola sp. MB14-C6]